MIPDFNTYLKESVWGDIRKKSLGKEEREENHISNIKELLPINMGWGILWADQDLEVGGEYLFGFDEAKELIKDSEWRLPNEREIRTLWNYGDRDYTHRPIKIRMTDDEFILMKGRNTELHFLRRGFMSAVSGHININSYACWVDVKPSTLMDVFSIEKYRSNDDPTLGFSRLMSSDKLCVRLVKK